MPVVYQSRVHRADLWNNPDVLYIFGDNCERRGSGGQAGEMRGEKNAVGIRTKKKPSWDKDEFFTDDELEENIALITEDFLQVAEHLAAGGVAVYPADGIGTGLSQMPERCPKTFAYLKTLGLGGAQARFVAAL